MNKEELINYCLSKPNAYIDYPFGVTPICFKVSGKIFAQLNTNLDQSKITLKANPEKSYFYREVYPDHVVRGYHCPPVQQPYWNTITLDGFSEEVLLTMIDEAYDEVVRKLTKKEKDRMSNICSLMLKTALMPNNQIIITAFDPTDNPIAMINLTAQDNQVVTLLSLSVDEDARGKGIAKELLRRADSEARQQGYRFIEVTLAEDSTIVQSLFHKMLYKPVGKANKYIRKL